MTSGKRENRQTARAILSACGHSDSGPHGVLDQSLSLSGENMSRGDRAHPPVRLIYLISWQSSPLAVRRISPPSGGGAASTCPLAGGFLTSCGHRERDQTQRQKWHNA